jgi:hypothetical protein
MSLAVSLVPDKDLPEATMNSRLRWVGIVVLVGAFFLWVGGRGAVDAQAPSEFKTGDFVQAGRFTVNKTRIDYVEQGERGQLYVFFTSKNSIVLMGDAAKALLNAIGSNGREKGSF